MAAACRRNAAACWSAEATAAAREPQPKEETQMRAGQFSRRDMLKASARCRDDGVRDAAARRGAGADRDHAGADRRGQEGRQGRLLHLDRPAGVGEDRQGVRGEVSRHRGAGRAHRRRARYSSASARNMRATSTPSMWSTPPTPLISSSGSATACWRPSCPEDVAKYYPAEQKDPDGQFASFRVCSQRHRLQHQSGEGGRRAEELRRPARSEMGRQDRQGASGLQRHHHDRDLRDRARPRLGLFREARQAARHAGAVRRRSAEEDRARRARRSWPTATTTS